MKPPIKPKKSLGQNFLTNPRVIHRIIDSCKLTKDDIVVEIGPGLGAITQHIAPHVKQLILIEKDKSLIPHLEELLKEYNVKIYQADILKFDFSQLSKHNIKLIGNLPYNIATAIIEKVIKGCNQFNAFYMMVQLEHGKRMLAKPHNKDYGSFSLFVQYYTHTKKLFNITKGSFNPVPKVESCFLEMMFKSDHELLAKNDEYLFKIIRQAFSERRKQIHNCLEKIEEKGRLQEAFQLLKLKPNLRAENLSLDQYIQLANHLHT